MKFIRGCTTLLCGMLLLPAARAELQLVEAEALALAGEPGLLALSAQEQARREAAVADGQLPDPKLKLGLMNFPTDSFDVGQEPMTQLQLGLQQMFPAGDSLVHKAKRNLYQADLTAEQRLDQAGMIRRDLRKAWLESFYWAAAGKVLDRNLRLFRQLLDITRNRYAAGGKNQQDVIRAELELEMLRDRKIRIAAMEETSRATLARWVGSEKSSQPLPAKLPELQSLPGRQALAEGLQRHPAIRMENARVSASQQTVAMARESYKPQWMLDLTYGRRNGQNMDGSPRADFLSAMVMVDLPLFTAKRQDKRLSASLQEQEAVMQKREARYRDMQSQVERHYANWERQAERVQAYRGKLIPKAAQNSEAALTAYQSDRGDFTMLMRARITELDTQLAALRVQVDHAKSQSELLYLAGEEG